MFSYAAIMELEKMRSEIENDSPRPKKVSTNLAARCREILEWHRTGLLPDGELRKFAETMPGTLQEHERLRVAEQHTADEAMLFVVNCSVSQDQC